MPEAYICDAVRTPIGRYAGGLSAVRTDDLAATPIVELMKRNPSVDWGGVDDVMYGCTNQAGEDNRNVARMAGLLAGLPPEVAGGDVQPPVRLRDGRGRERRPRDQGGGGGADRRGGGREHVPRPLRDEQGSRPVRPGGRDARQHDRVALREPADEGAVRGRVDGVDGGERGGPVPDLPGRPGPVRPAKPAEDRRGRRERAVPGGDRPGRSPEEKGGGCRGRGRRASAAGHHAGGPRPPEADRAARRDGDRRKRLGGERRRVRAPDRFGGGGETERPDPAGAHRRDGRRRSRPAGDGDRTDPRDPEGAGPRGPRRCPGWT